MEAKVAELRSQLPVLAGGIYLNTGTSGPMPDQVAEAMRQSVDLQSVDLQWQKGRIHSQYFPEMFRTRAELKAELAGLLHCDPFDLALTQSTTEGMNIITLGVPWQPGDEAITTDLEHPAALFPLFTVRERFGVTVRTARLREEPEAAVERIRRLITPRTRLISLSHVSYLTGAVLPVAEICRMAHTHGVPVLVDGAQAFAAIPVNLPELECDFYTLPGQKWICGPEGMGALYAARDALPLIRPVYTGYASITHVTMDGIIRAPGAQRLELGIIQPALVAGLTAAIRWWRSEVGADWAFARIAGLVRRARSGLGQIPGVKLLTPAEPAGLITFTVDGLKPEQVVSALEQRGIVIRAVPDPAAARVATGFYNTHAEVDRFVQAVAELKSGV